MCVLKILLLIITTTKFCKTEFTIPKVKIEINNPKGLKASFRDEFGIQKFSFHANLNKPILGFDKGMFKGETSKATNGYWVYYDPEFTAEIGDVLNYWYLVFHQNLGYRKVNLQYVIKGMKNVTKNFNKIERKSSRFLEKNIDGNSTKLNCSNSQTKMEGGKIPNEIIFRDDFLRFDKEKWYIEQYIPLVKGPDFEFNFYANDAETVYIQDSILHLKPKFQEDFLKIRTLDFRGHCSKETEEECYRESRAFMLPSIKSGRIRSKFSFKLGKVTIRAKLPIGDWIYPSKSDFF